MSGLKYTYYFAHRVLRQFGYDRDIPLVFKEVVSSLPSLDPFLRLIVFLTSHGGALSLWCQIPIG